MLYFSLLMHCKFFHCPRRW